MATFAYKIRTTEGKTLKGNMEAATETEALLNVRKLGGVMLELTEKKSKGAVVTSEKGLSKKKIPLKERIILTEQLSVMLNAGITLVQALKGLAEECTNKNEKAILERVVADVESGVPFSSALEKYPLVFSRIFCQMVRSAEKTGNLADILNKLTSQQQKEYELKGKVRGALMYPAVVMCLLVAVILVVITFILPKLTGLFASSGTELPMSTQILLGISAFLSSDWYLVLAGLVALIFGFRYALKTEKGRWAYDAFILKVPVLGTFFKKSYMARFTQSFASLAQAGIPVLDAFVILRGVIGNVVYEHEVDLIAKDVENGVKVSTAIRKSKYFPAMIGQLVSVGEQSGDLGGVFGVLGEFFEKEVDGMAKNLSTLLEPIIMIIMGVVIGFILVSVLQPIYGLVNTGG